MKRALFLILCVISGQVLVACTEEPTSTPPPTSTAVPTLTPAATATPEATDVVITEAQAIKLAMELFGRPAPEIETVEDAHDPRAMLMFWSEEEALHDGSTLEERTLVWVVQAQGTWRSSEILPVGSPRISNVAIEVLDALTGAEIAVRRSDEPHKWQYIQPPVPGLGSACDYPSSPSLQALANKSPLIVKGTVIENSRFTDIVQVERVLKGTIPNSTIRVGGGLCDAPLPLGEVVLFLYSYSALGAKAGPFHFVNITQGVFLVRYGKMVPADAGYSGHSETSALYQGMSEVSFLNELAEAIKVE